MSVFPHFCANSFLCILAVLLVAAFQQSEAVDVCSFDSGTSFCDYGCCSDSCCDMSKLALAGLIVGALLALASLVGCIICLACMCKQSRANRDATTVHPIHTNTNSVYVHNSSAHPPPRPPPSYGQHGQYGSYPGSTDTMYGFNDAAYPPGANPPPAYSYSNPRSDKS